MLLPCCTHCYVYCLVSEEDFDEALASGCPVSRRKACFPTFVSSRLVILHHGTLPVLPTIDDATQLSYR